MIITLINSTQAIIIYKLLAMIDFQVYLKINLIT